MRDKEIVTLFLQRHQAAINRSIPLQSEQQIQTNEIVKKDHEMASVIFSLLLGMISGVISKAGDAAVTGTFWGNLLWNIGLVTSGFLIWCTIGCYNAIASKSLKQAVIRNALFFASMFASYYLYSYFAVDYFSPKVVVFWFVMIIPVVLLTYLIRKYRGSRILKGLSIAAACALFLLDVFFIQGVEWIPLILELLLLACTIFLIVKYHSAGGAQEH